MIRFIRQKAKVPFLVYGGQEVLHRSRRGAGFTAGLCFPACAHHRRPQGGAKCALSYLAPLPQNERRCFESFQFRFTLECYLCEHDLPGFRWPLSVA